MSELSVVTGAFGYTGKYIAHRLLSMGKRVKTITGHPGRRDPFGGRVSAAPFYFDHPGELVKELSGAATLYNTYWVRFSRGRVTFDRAIENTKILIQAALDAGVQRIVHISITNPSLESPFPYFRGKAIVEHAIAESGLSYSIIRPAFIFGVEDILLNNIAWLLRRFPIFMVPGSGNYRLQPIFVEDLAELAVEAADQQINTTMDAAGPEVYSFNEMIRLVAEETGSKARIVHLAPGLALLLSRMVGYVLGDVVLTRDEVDGLLSELLVSSGPVTGKTSMRTWLRENAKALGSEYASELDRHYRG